MNVFVFFLAGSEDDYYMYKNGKTEISTMEKRLVKLSELAEMAKLSCLIRRRTLTTFIIGSP